MCVFIFPVVGSLQPVRADLIQEGSNSDFLIPPWKKCLAHSGCRVLSLRGEAAPLRKGTGFREEPQRIRLLLLQFPKEGVPWM